LKDVLIIVFDKLWCCQPFLLWKLSVIWRLKISFDFVNLNLRLLVFFSAQMADHVKKLSGLWQFCDCFVVFGGIICNKIYFPTGPSNEICSNSNFMQK